MSNGSPVPECLHTELRFGSGGFHIFCPKCGVRWAAEKDGTIGPVSDLNRVDSRLDGETRVKP